MEHGVSLIATIAAGLGLALIFGFAAELPMSTERKYIKGLVVMVGYGGVGRRIGTVFYDEEALAQSMLGHVLERMGR